MDKRILIEYSNMVEEIKDIKKRIKKLESEIINLTVVSDSVKGTRKDGTIGSIKITGYPVPEEAKKQGLLKRYRKLLGQKEEELLELTIKAEEYIQTIEKSELRIMFRFYFIDNMSYAKTAANMNMMFPKRRIKYTDENIKKRILRFFENVPQCPDKRC